MSETAEIRAVVRTALDAAVASSQITRAQAQAWAEGARLEDNPTGQSQLAATHRVSTRTIRQWVGCVDRTLAEHFSSWTPTPAPAADLDPVEDDIEVAVRLARLRTRMTATRAAPETVDAVRAFAIDRLGGRRVRRADARRWVRKRAYDTVADRLDILKSAPVQFGELVCEHGPPTVIPVPYAISDDPDVALSELVRAWHDRARQFIPLLANQALRVLTFPHVPASYLLHALEVITNALRDAENSQAFECAAAWRRLAIQVGGPRDYRVWKASGVLIHMMQIHGHTDAARRAQHRQIDTFSQVEFPDIADREIHLHDRLARLIAIELQDPNPRSVEQAQRALNDLRRAHESRTASTAESLFAVDRRRVEVALVRCQYQGRGQRAGRRPEFDAAVDRIELSVAALEPHRALAALELLLHVDVQRHDWPQARTRIELIDNAASIPGAPANIIARLDNTLAELAGRGVIDSRHLPPAHDPFRDTRFLPPT